MSTEVKSPPEESDKKQKWPPYSMVEPRMRRIYFRFYKETYKSSQIDRKTKELIAIAALWVTSVRAAWKGTSRRLSSTEPPKKRSANPLPSPWVSQPPQS